MAWVRISDDFYDHPKMAALTPMALGWWVTALAWCNRNLTDGDIPRAVAVRLVDFNGCALGDSDYAVEQGEAPPYTWLTCTNELVEAGVLEEDGRYFRVVDYLDYQPSSATVRAEREKNAQRQKDWRERNKGRDAVTNKAVTGAPNPNPNPKNNNTSSATADAEFAEWWAVYPRKVGKSAAARSYVKARKSADAATILAGLRRALTSRDFADPQYIPHPTTWLNQGRWEDEPLTLDSEDQPAARRTLAQCDAANRGECDTPHPWEDARNLYHCQGA